jgi:hypothetical protein
MPVFDEGNKENEVTAELFRDRIMAGQNQFKDRMTGA